MRALRLRRESVYALGDDHFESSSGRAVSGQSTGSRYYDRLSLLWFYRRSLGNFLAGRLVTRLDLVVLHSSALARLGARSRNRFLSTPEVRRPDWFDVAKRVSLRAERVSPKEVAYPIAATVWTNNQ